MDASYGQLYETLYHGHWWWRAREAILLRELGRLPVVRPARVLDVGCGNGLFFPKLEAWGEVCGIEIDTDLVPADSPHRERIFHEPLGHARYDGLQFDAITALDVVEHVEDDTTFVANLVAMLAPGGHLLITVPAFQCLWDEHDEINRHYRRYRLGMLRELLSPHGELVRLRYLFPTLFLAKAGVAAFGRARGRPVQQAQVPSSGVTAVVSRALNVEDRLSCLLRPPIGSSALAVLRKPAASANGQVN